MTGKKGETIAIEVFAARYGSVLVPELSLFHESGRRLAIAEPIAGSSDCRLVFQIPNAGRYCLSLIDAHDRGGATHPYRIVINRK